MAKRSQKSRFGPGKDRIKPDTDADGATTVDSEEDDSVDGRDEADSGAAGDQSRDDSKGGKGKKGRKGNAKNRSGSDEPDEGTVSQADAEHADDDAQTGAYISKDGEQNPQTCCSSCHTVFEVSRELLESSDTRVRCGECLSIFDALANLRDNDTDNEEQEAPAAAKAGKPESDDKPTPASASKNTDAPSSATSAGDASPLDVTYADFALFSADAGLPELDYLDETREVPPFDFDDPGDEDDMDESIGEGLYSNDVIEDARGTLSDGPSDQDTESSDDSAEADKTAAGPSQVDETPEVVDEIDELLSSLKSPELPVLAEEEPVGAWWFRGLLFMGVLVLAAGLYGYREREALQNNAVARPVLESICSLFGCTVAERVDLAALKVTRRTVFSHPDDDDLLIINIGFVNQAEFAQRYPTLEILLTDRSGRLIVKHDYQPVDYLDSWQAGDVLDVGKSLDISLSVEDPGNEAMSFELDFR